MIYKETARIVETVGKGDYLRLTLESPDIARTVRAGQFVNVRVSEGFDPLLRRPISVMDAEGDTILLFVQVRGKGTRILAGYSAGDTLNLLGPLGNTFPEAAKGKNSVYVAGGAGAAPFRFLSRRACGGLLLAGARTAKLLPDPADLGKYCGEVRIATDDGSGGTKGTVVDLLGGTDPRNSVYYACGPRGMLAAFRRWVLAQDPVPEAYVSLETYMACGIGACKCCVVPQTDGTMKLCCHDGPVFPAGEVEL